MKNRNKIKLDPGTRALRIISYVFVSIWALICLLPFILVISASFSTESIVAKEGFGLLPKGFTLSAYELVFRSPKMILGSYGVTIALTVCGTVVGLFIIAMTGYALQRKDFPFSKCIVIFYLLYNTVFRRYGTNLYLGFQVPEIKRKLYGSIFTAVNVSVADHSDEEFANRYHMKLQNPEKIDGAGDFKNFRITDFPDVKAGTCNGRTFSGTGILE